MELCPRPKLSASKAGKRVKMNITVDENLYALLEQAHENGFNTSHVIDSGLWLLFDKPKLSFER